MHFTINCLILAVIGTVAYAAMSEEQMQQMKNMVKKMCQSKNGVTTDVLDKFIDGDFPEDRNVKCYFSCLLTTAQMLKGNKLNTGVMGLHSRVVKTMLPPDLQAKVLPTVNACKNITGADSCQVAYEFIKCHYQTSGKEGFMFA